MNRSAHPSSLENTEYTFSLNSNIVNETGDEVNLQTEPSNLLCSVFKPGYKVIKAVYNVDDGKTYFFLTNPTTLVSEIGFINGAGTINIIDDIESECDCDIKNKLAEPLEDTVQEETCNYTTLISDACNKCLAFSIYKPITTVVFNGPLMFFTDGINTRYINLDNIDDYKFFKKDICDNEPIENCEQDPLCEDCEDCTECPNCEKMDVFKNFVSPCVESIDIISGGNLKMGTYQFFKAACTLEGQELSEYFTLTAPISIFDKVENTMNQTMLNRETNLAISVETENNDDKFEYYKIAVVYVSGLDGAFRIFENGIYPYSTTSFTHSTNNNKKEITSAELFRLSSFWKSSKGMTTSDGRLFHFSLTENKTINLQPVANLMGAFMRWATGVAKENLYADAASESQFGSYLRNENYPFMLEFELTDGRVLPPVILTHRPPINGDGTFAQDEEFIVIEDGTPTVEETEDDLNSVNQVIPDCGTTRNKKWQYYNTATKEESTCGNFDPETGIDVEEQSTADCIVENIAEILSGELELPNDVEFGDLISFINQNKEEFCPGGKYEFVSGASEVCDILNGNYDAETCTPEVSENCAVGDLLSEEILAYNSENTEVVELAKDLEDYEATEPNPVNFMYEAGNYDGRVLDTAFQTFTGVSTDVFKRNSQPNEICSSAVNILNTSSQSYFLDYETGASFASLVNPSITVGTASSGFSTNLHKRAIWFKFDFNGRDKALIEVTPQTLCSVSELFSGNTLIRFSTYDSCSSTVSIDTTQIDLSTGDIIELLRADYASDEILIAIDAPIVEVSPTVFYINPNCGSFSIIDRPYEIEGFNVTFDSLKFLIKRTYEVTCTFKVPEPSDCEVLPYQEGKFGYFESTRTYPDNAELFDSSSLVIKENDIPLLIKDEFEEYFSDGVDLNGNYILNEKTNLRCKPVRLYKMPNNDLAPFMFSNNLPSFKETLIFPLGVKLDNRVINFFLDVAVDNNLISQSDRDKIFRVRLYRGDRTLDRSIVAKGIMFDTYKYTDINSKEVLYPNYPYNCLGADTFHYQDRDSNTLIGHPFSEPGNNSGSNNRFTFHSPDIHFRKPHPTLPQELIYEGYQFGRSRGSFAQVEDHPEYVLLGKSAYTTATTLGIIEAALELATVVGKAYLDFIQTLYVEPVTGGFNPGAPAAAVWAGAIAGAQGLANSTLSVGRYRYQWLQIFRNNGRKHNFAYKYGSFGWYNSLKYQNSYGNILRGLTSSVYLKGGGRYNINEKGNGSTVLLNNEDRESSVFLSTGSFPISYSSEYKNYDNYDTNRSNASRRTAGEAGTPENNQEFDSNIASPYVSLRQYLPEQYGDIHNIRWIPTNNCVILSEDNSCKINYGGDIKLTRMSLKRKLPHFLVNAMGLADYTPFAYSLYKNIGDTNYFSNFDVELSETLGASLQQAIFPDIGSEFKMDNFNNGFYIKHPSKFYLFSYGIPQFMVESEINQNYRYSRNEPRSWFFPNGNAVDYNWWTQEKNVSIKFDNEYNFNPVYMMNSFYGKRQLLPTNFSSEIWDKRANFVNGVIASQQDNSSFDTTSPWLTYNPADIYEFSEINGRLVDLSAIESNQLLARFTKGYSIINSIDTLRERLNETNYKLGVGIFAQRPIQSYVTKVGYAGTQHMTLESSEFGRFYVDAMRGQVMLVAPNAQSVIEISAYKRGGQPSGMREWFKEHLPFKILRGNISGITELDLDNAYNSVGIATVWDSRNRRFILTKKDYTVKDEYRGKISYSDGKFFTVINSVNTEIFVHDTKYFTEASFTIAYSYTLDAWISYYSFLPNYYIGYNNYFQSGINNTYGSGVWSHLLTNRSFLVFYGKRYPWTVEIPSNNKFANKTFNGSQVWLDVKRYHNEYDFADITNRFFNKAWVYNNSDNTGNIELIPHKPDSYKQLAEFPKYESDKHKILVTQYDKHWSFNDCFNNVRRENSNVPVWLNDINYIHKEINSKAINYKNFYEDRLRGDWFLTRLSMDNESRFRMIFKWAFNNENLYV